MSNLIGLEIEVNGRRKFVGKSGICPATNIPYLQGRKILYKEESWKDVISYKMQTFGIDADAYYYALNELKIEGIVCFCADKKMMLLISKEKMENAFPVELGGGEGVQLRLPVKDIKIVEDASPIRMGYTRDVVKVPSVTPIGVFPQVERQRDNQAKLFAE